MQKMVSIPNFLKNRRVRNIEESDTLKYLKNSGICIQFMKLFRSACMVQNYTTFHNFETYKNFEILGYKIF